MAAIDAADRPVHPEDDADRRLRARRLPRARARRRGRARRDVDPSRLARPLARAAPARRARLAQLHARGELAVGDAFVNESRDRHALHRARRGGDDGRRAAGDRARDHRPRVDHRHGPVPARRRRPVPGRLRAVTREVVVVGAGIVGAAVARELAVRGVGVTLLDRGEVSGGTTGLGEGNVLCSDKDAGPELELARAGLALYDELEARLGDEARDPAQGRADRASRRGDVGGGAGAARSGWAIPGARLLDAGRGARGRAGADRRDPRRELLPRRPAVRPARDRPRARRARPARPARRCARAARSWRSPATASRPAPASAASAVSRAPRRRGVAAARGRARRRAVERAARGERAGSPLPLEPRKGQLDPARGDAPRHGPAQGRRRRPTCARVAERRRPGSRSPPSWRPRGRATCSSARRASGAGSTRRSIRA